MKNCMCANKLKVKSCGKIKNISNKCKSKRRLYELGLYKGANVKIIKNDIGPIILDISGNKLAIGRRLAEDILIEID